LTFIARRLLTERVAMVFAVRETGEDHLLAGLDELDVAGLRSQDARALLASATPGRLDARLEDRIVAETRGNPLALLELPHGRTRAELAGGFERPDTRLLATQIEQSFLRRVLALPVDTQLLLLAAAAEPMGDVAVLRRAAEHLGIGLGAATPAQTAQLIEIDTRVRFRHPLVRSTVYGTANATARREVHRALVAATCPDNDPDRRAWHAAHAASGPDEAVAAELERSAARARGRGGVAAEASFLERATELTPDAARRGTRALAAAEAKIEAAAPDAAGALLEIAEAAPLQDLQRAQLARLRAQLVFARNHGTDAAPMLFALAAQLENLDAASARDTYLETLGATVFAGRLGDPLVCREVALAALAVPRPPGPPRPIDLLLDGVATRLTDGYAAARAAAAAGTGRVPVRRVGQRRRHHPLALAGVAGRRGPLGLRRVARPRQPRAADRPRSRCAHHAARGARLSSCRALLRRGDRARGRPCRRGGFNHGHHRLRAREDHPDRAGGAAR
jgi:hypothetical protein